MKKTADKKVTIESILKKKRIIEETIHKPYYSEFFGGEIDIEEHSIENVIDVINANEETPLRGDFELIYKFCPIFRSKTLHEEFGVKDPIDVVELAFAHNMTEIKNLAKTIIKRYGLDIDKVEQTKK